MDVLEYEAHTSSASTRVFVVRGLSNGEGRLLDSILEFVESVSPRFIVTFLNREFRYSKAFIILLVYVLLK